MKKCWLKLLPQGYHGSSFGSISELRACSFYSLKIIATGESEMLRTGSDEYDARARMTRMQGNSYRRRYLLACMKRNWSGCSLLGPSSSSRLLKKAEML